jgi:Bacteriophage HK97-gp10, putative tail-component
MAEPFITYKLTVPNIPLLHAEQSRQVLYREASMAVRTIVEDIASEARTRTPVNTGILRASIGTNVTTGTSLSEAIRGTVFTGAQAPYAPYVEEGTAPHWAPIGPLLLWARRVLGNERAAYAVQRAIARRGTRGRHMFRDALAAVAPRAQGIFADAMARAARILQGGS